MSQIAARSARTFGSPLGLVICVALGFALYGLFSVIGGANPAFDYATIIDHITSSLPKQLAWFLMDWTEPTFYASAFAGAGLILGGVVAWVLALRRSRLAGFTVCYGEHAIFPWVLASQLISLALSIFVFRYIDGFNVPGVTAVATFVPIVAAPPAAMLIYGPSVPALLVSSVLGGLMCAPVATWLAVAVTGPLGLPGVVANVTSMALCGFTIFMVLKALPWVKKVPVPDQRPTLTPVEDVHTTSWFVRRVIAEFSEAPFYGSESASILMFVGLLIGTLLCAGHNVNGAGTALPAILLSQFVAAAVGVFLYANKFAEGGWYATYVPVVSVGPACVLALGASIPVALVAGALGGILGGPVAEFVASRLPDDVHPTVGNVASMALCTAFVYVVMAALPWF